MAKIYMKYTPVKAGLTGAEFLAPFLDEHFNGITFTGIVSDDMNHYGYLEGTGDLLSKSLMAINGRFSVKILEEEDIIGFANLLYNPIEPIDGTAVSFIEFMSGHGITVSSELDAVKKMRKTLFKEITKRKFDDYNDLIADLSKAVTLFNHHYADLDVPTKAAVDANVATLKSIYDSTTCVAAFDKMVTNLGSILSSYYTAVTNVDNAADIDAVNAVIYE